MKAYLKGIDKEYEIPEGESIVGRHNQNSAADIQIQELGMENISRNHCELENHEGILRIKDLDSKNGTYINDEKMDPHGLYQLNNLDLLRLGNCTLEVKIKQNLFG